MAESASVGDNFLEMPVISLVTPVLNAEPFLGSALRCVLDQGYEKLQYVVMDGGSTDGSLGLIEQESAKLHYWRTGPDHGIYDAINQGFRHTDGEVMGWLNADDLLAPWALGIVGEIFARFPEVEWLTTRYPLRWDVEGRVISCRDAQGYSRKALLVGDAVPERGMRGIWPVQQAATFWRRSLWERSGGFIDVSFTGAADFELWLRFAKFADPVAVGVPLGGVRKHGGSKEGMAREFYLEQTRSAFEHNLCERSGGWHRWWRDLGRRRGRGFWNGVFVTLGYFYPAWRIERTRDGAHWRKEMVYI